MAVCGPLDLSLGLTTVESQKAFIIYFKPPQALGVFFIEWMMRS